ncbi:MAG TPA: Gfo/Idh/MocA family oxidoreductase [Anaerolineales bacterium]|nr:Gfo/Idh/MocA family oxidoreductase [Anaerolineales bacterium]
MKNIGIIGCGKIAQIRHIPEYANQSSARLVGFFDLNLPRAEQLAAMYKAKAYATYEDLIADPLIDAISVCTSNVTHAEISIKALNAGKHVLCEKPMATNLDDCLDMAAAAKANNRFLMIGHNQRFTKAHQKARELVLQGEIGEIITFRTVFGHAGPETWSIDPGPNTWFFDPNKAAMGVMADLGIHKTDLIHFLTGLNIIETSAKLTTLNKRDSRGNLIGVDDNALCIYTLQNGAIGTMTVSWTHYGAENNSTILYGSKGILRIYDDPKHSLILIKENGEIVNFDLEQIQTNDNQTDSGVIAEFVKCLENQVEPQISAEEAIKAMRVVFASQISSELGCSVIIKQNAAEAL